MVEFFEGHPVARQAAVAISRMESVLAQRQTGTANEEEAVG
jgi:hypothetical protein